ncbi:MULTISPECIES: TetR/AcrR family transcriptional regulator [unclassified Arthrobacter]|uniref:TetR/AcrR family transcriptional regulator n=1 Tax=unclassified Arthrobacter TaxID=235627 RepID=UPI002883180C|nr:MULTISPECIES: TetR/AcrR family transcriptional regulator [unclassified Arthrobacter]
MRTRRKSGSYEVGRAKRAEILDAATRLFATSGYHKVPLSQVAADAGLSESGLLHHFRSKKHLLLGVAERRLEQTAQWWSSQREQNSDDPLEVFTTMVESTRALLREPGLIELFVLVSAEAADSSTPAHQLYATWYERAVGETAQLLAAGVEHGFLRAETNVNGCAREIIAVSDGLQLQWVLSGGELDLVAAIRDYARRLALALLTPDHAAKAESL